MVDIVTNESEQPIETLQFDNGLLSTHVISSFIEEFGNKGIDPPLTTPEPLHHIFQVTTVAKNIVSASNMEDRYKRLEIYKAERFGLTHDIGRAKSAGIAKYSPEDHPRDGRKILNELGFADIYQDFAVDHHQMGLGLELPERPNYITMVKEKGVQALCELYDKKYGLAGLASVIADLSKAYEDKSNTNMPSIAVFDLDRSERLIQRQIDNGMEIGGERHKNELLGREFILACIHYIGEKYGVDYVQALQNAKDEWDKSEKSRVENIWQKQLAKNRLKVQPMETTQ